VASEQAQSFIDQATQSIQNSDFKGALEFIEQAIALEPNSSDAYVIKGVALSQTAEADAAVEAFRQAIMLSPYNAKAYFNLGVHYFSTGNKVGAEEMAREAVRIDPRHAGARDLLSRIEAERAPEKPISTAIEGPSPYSPGGGQAPSSSGPPFGEPQRPAPSAQPPTGSSPYESSPHGTSPYGTSPEGAYYRPGYESSSTVHSLSFVENLGSSWSALGYVIGGIGTAIAAINWGKAILVDFPAMMNDMEAFAQSQSGFLGSTPGQMALSMISMLVALVALIWMILELTDRRGPWLWMLPFVICCCCGFHGPVILIYMWKGRS